MPVDPARPQVEFRNERSVKAVSQYRQVLLRNRYFRFANVFVDGLDECGFMSVPQQRVSWTSFSLFGGDIIDLVEQIAGSPAETQDEKALLQSALSIVKERDVLVVDDIHLVTRRG